MTALQRSTRSFPADRESAEVITETGEQMVLVCSVLDVSKEASVRDDGTPWLSVNLLLRAAWEQMLDQMEQRGLVADAEERVTCTVSLTVTAWPKIPGVTA